MQVFKVTKKGLKWRLFITYNEAVWVFRNNRDGSRLAMYEGRMCIRFCCVLFINKVRLVCIVQVVVDAFPVPLPSLQEIPCTLFLAKTMQRHGIFFAETSRTVFLG